ncbi:MAG: SDR family oxidoreductase [Gemmataceae bacterium]
MPRLNNKRALLLGGSGGIGLATARRFLQEGARLVLAGLEPIPADTLVSLQTLGDVQFVQCDATQPADIDRLFAATRERLGGLDILFHIAGASGRTDGDGSLHECSDSGWRRTIDINLTSVFLSNRAALRLFLEQGRGVILNMASVLAFHPAPEHFDTAAYTAAKGGVLSLTRLAAARYAAHGIRVNALAPGLIDTPMAGRAIGDPAIRSFLEAKQPLGPGAGRPDDVAEAAVFLCSDESRLITGVVLPVDGGWSTR